MTNNDDTNEDVPLSKMKSNVGSMLKLNKSSASSVTDTTPCNVCNVRYYDPPFDKWIRCPKCSKWYHKSCGPGDTSTCYFCL